MVHIRDIDMSIELLIEMYDERYAVAFNDGNYEMGRYNQGVADGLREALRLYHYNNHDPLT